MIKMGDLKQVKSTIEMGTQEGMITLEKSAELLEARGVIRKEDYIGYMSNEDF
jgi:Tfp pilus assembly pilus retraction ATPase PilT